MWFARIGGVLLLCGGLLVVGAILSAPRISGSPDLEGLIDGPGGGGPLSAALALIGIGVAGFGSSDSELFDGRGLRKSLWTLAIGLFIVSATLLASQSGAAKGPNADMLLVPLATGALATVGGALVTGLALGRGRTPSKLVASVFLTGLALLVLGNWARQGSPPQPSAVATSAIGGIVLAIGCMALGLLGIAARSPREAGSA